ncbi:MAG TPA: TonB-dependent receptor [Rhodocyclaceae bacterium]|nr:TonB-dependent receptor [Rhodocyclaceae bacterium]
MIIDKPLPKALLLLLFTALSHSSVAATKGELGDSEDFPVVLSASRLRQPLIESPSAVTVIDRAMIEASGARHIADLLRFVPGTVVSYNDGNRPVVAIHGMSGTYASGVQVLIDGVSVYSPLWGGMQWEELPLAMNDIERIEVIRGPNAAIFGSNSFSGAINIITRHPSSDQGVQVSVNAGNRGVADFSVSNASSLENGLKYRMTFGQRASDGFDTRPDSQRMLYGNLRAEYQVTPTEALQVSARVADNKKDVGDYTATGSSRVPHPDKSDLAQLQVRWTHAVSADNEWWIQYYHLQSRTEDLVTVDFRQSSLYASIERLIFNKFGAGGLAIFRAPLPPTIPYVANSGFGTQRDGIEFQQTSRWTPSVRSVWGMETRRDVAESSMYLASGSVSSFLTRLYGNLEWLMAPKWTLNVAAMAERNSFASLGYSPKMSLAWQPINGHVFRIGVSAAQRTPSSFETKANTSYAIPPEIVAASLGSLPSTYSLSLVSQVDSETVRTDELGYSFSIPEWQVGGDVRWASEHYHGLITKTQTGFANVDRINVDSNDITIYWRPMEGSLLRVALSHTKVDSPTAPATFNSSAPMNTVSLLWDQRIAQDWRGSINYQRVGEMRWTDAGNSPGGNPVLPAIDYLNLRIAKKLRVTALSDEELSLIVQNALGKHREYFAGVAANNTAETIAPRIVFLQFNGRF